MKKIDIFKFSLLLLITALGMFGCGKDKHAEIVEDPIAKSIEYYVTGLVVSGTTPLSGVTVTAGDQTATTDADGLYSLTFTSTGTYTVSFAKDGYMSLTDGVAVISSSASNRTSVSLDAVLSALGETVTVAPSETTTVTELGEGDDASASTGVIIPANSSSTSFAITVTPYVEAQTSAVTSGTTAENLSLTNVLVTTSESITLAEDATLFFNNPATDGTHFSGVDFYKKSSTKASSSWVRVGDVTYDATSGKYKATISAGNTLDGEYSMRVEATKTVGTTTSETVTEFTKSNADNLDAIYGYSFSYSTKSGWDYTTASQTTLSLLNDGFAILLKSIVAEQEGGIAGIRTIAQTLTVDISGNYLFYFLAEAQYANITYNLSTSTGLAITLVVKKYVGNTITYTLTSADSHSGGHSGGGSN